MTGSREGTWLKFGRVGKENGAELQPPLPLGLPLCTPPRHRGDDPLGLLLRLLEPTPLDVDTSDMTSSALPATWILPSPLTRILLGALVGTVVGFLVGVLMYGYKCVAYGTSYVCDPTQEIKIGLLTVAGLVTGLLASRLSRSMSSNLQRILIAAAIMILVVLVVAWTIRSNACWYGSDSCHPYFT